MLLGHSISLEQIASQIREADRVECHYSVSKMDPYLFYQYASLKFKTAVEAEEIAESLEMDVLETRKELCNRMPETFLPIQLLNL